MQSGFSTAEIAFQAEDVSITIIPKQSLPPLDMAGWRSPQLRAMRRAEVPLWFAIVLKRQDRCSIVWPDWLDPNSLNTFVESERRDQSRFSELPWFWQPVSQMLLKEASDDFNNGQVDGIMQSLQELREIRQSKIRAGMLLANESNLKMDGLGAMEINEVRPVLSQTMRTLQKIKDAQA